MLEFTYQQKIAMLRILLDIIHADGVIDIRELAMFSSLKTRLELEESDRKVVTEKNSLLALTQIKEFSQEQKLYFANLMSEMILVDNDIDCNEIAIYNVVRDFCGITQNFDYSATIDELRSEAS